MICYPNRIDESTLAGGGWSPALPLANALDPLLALRARSVDAAPASTVIEIDLRRIRPVRAVAVIDHNLTALAEYRVTAAADGGLDDPLVLTDWLPVFPVIYPFGSVQWEDEHFWTGRAVEDDVEGYRMDLIHLFGNAQLIRRIRIALRDPGNLAGFVEFGRLFVGDGFAPVYNMSYGNAFNWQPRTDVSEALSGTETFDVRRARRVQTIALDWLTPGDAVAAMELQRTLGIHGEILYLHDPDDMENRHRRCFLGRLEALSPIEHPYLNTHRWPVRVREIL
ncbi:MAG: hypothetical protein LBE85_04360 [Candidatus Accumulibacter sp.]|nr:hypothetical protein [Accumulibacter sp.]